MAKRRRPRSMREWAEKYPRLYLAASSLFLFLAALILTLVGIQLLELLLTPTRR
jgi:hypothetical protein